MATDWWTNLGIVEKRVAVIAGLVSGLLVIGGAAWAGGSAIALDYEVDAKIAAVEDKLSTSLNRSEILRLKREIKRLQQQLENPDLTHSQRVRIENDIKEYQELIACIRAGQELCY